MNIILNVQEKQLREFNLGLRWDNYYDLVATANIQLNSNLLPGLRIENQIQFAGIRKNIFSIYYPSRRLTFPAYPFVKVTNLQYPYKLYDNGEYDGRYTLKTDRIDMGIGFLLKNYWNTEFEYFWKKSGLQSEENLENPLDQHNINEYLGIRIMAQLDLLDNVLLPKDGIFIKGKHENSRTELGSRQNYEFYQAWGRIYKTFRLNTYGIS